jgi:two-component SAPR family response regulator
VPETRLLDALWPDAEGDAASQALATTLFRLRKLIGERTIRRQENRLTLDPSVCWVDSWAFERLTGDDTADPKSRASRLQRLYQGPFLDGEEGPWACPMRERLSAKRARLGGPIPPP